MERRGRIPVATYRTPEGKTRSRSRVRDPNYNKTDPETDLFTLLEDNIALREENESLQSKNSKFEEEKQTFEKERSNLKTRIKELEGQHEMLRSQMVEINLTLNKTIEEKMFIKQNQQQSGDKVKKLTRQIEDLKSSQIDYTELIAANKLLKEEISKLVPTANTNEFESLMETQKDTSHLIAIECIQKLIAEFTQLKTNLNNAELHLYEANEKISELLENQTHLEEEIEQLRTENTNLTRVAELMTSNMRESVNTSKKMEEALIEMKRRNDELTKRASDTLDGGGCNIVNGQRKVSTLTIMPGEVSGTSTTPTPNTNNEEITRLRDEINRRDLAHGERIVEMKKLMDATIENTTNDEIRLLRLRVEMLEKDLKFVTERAEKAETKLVDYEEKITKFHNTTITTARLNNGDGCTKSHHHCHVGDECYHQSSKTLAEHLESETAGASRPSGLHNLPPPPPPPPPPPMPQFDFKNPPVKIFKGAQNLNDGIASLTLKTEENGNNLKRKQQVESTGLDALVKELKDGHVTLRRARRRTQTNAALKELFDVLEQSRTQNRNSKIFIENMTEMNFGQSDF